VRTIDITLEEPRISPDGYSALQDALRLDEVPAHPLPGCLPPATATREDNP